MLKKASPLKIVGKPEKAFIAKLCGIEKQAKFSTNLYNLMMACPAYGINPSCYFRQLFAELPKLTHSDDISILIPLNIEIFGAE